MEILVNGMTQKVVQFATCQEVHVVSERQASDKLALPNSIATFVGEFAHPKARIAECLQYVAKDVKVFLD